MKVTIRATRSGLSKWLELIEIKICERILHANVSFCEYWRRMPTCRQPTMPAVKGVAQISGVGLSEKVCWIAGEVCWAAIPIFIRE